MLRSGRALVFALLPALGLVFCAAAGAAGGSFASSDPLLNGIWGASVKTALGVVVPGPLTTDALGRDCAIELPRVIVDGPLRDRCPYVGDEAVTDLTLDVSTPQWPVQRDMLGWFASRQHDDGAIPASPYSNASVVLVDYSAYWILALANYVLYSGDVALAHRVWPNLVKVLDGYYAAHTQGGLLAFSPGSGDYAYLRRQGDTVAYYNAQYSLALQAASRLAGWVGDSKHAAAWEARRQKLARMFAGAFWDSGAGAFKDTTEDPTTHPQDAQAFAILAGLATAGERSSALSYLDRHTQRGYGNTITDSNAWDSQTVGSDVKSRVYPFISYFEVLARYDAGRYGSALDLIRREWGYMLKNGPRSTMWETIGPFGGAPTDSTPSWAAGWSSGAAPALTNYVLGVQPTSPGYATFTVTPHAGFGVSWARGAVVTPHGLLRVSWRFVGGRVRVSVGAPAGTRWTNATR
jgi:hypothetical protein